MRPGRVERSKPIRKPGHKTAGELRQLRYFGEDEAAPAISGHQLPLPDPVFDLQRHIARKGHHRIGQDGQWEDAGLFVADPRKLQKTEDIFPEQQIPLGGGDCADEGTGDAGGEGVREIHELRGRVQDRVFLRGQPRRSGKCKKITEGCRHSRRNAW